MQTHETTSHKLFHLYYMKFLHDKFLLQEKEKISYTSIPKINIDLFKHFSFYPHSSQILLP